MKILFLAAFVPFPIRDGDCVRAAWTLKSLSRRHELSAVFLDTDGIRVPPPELKKYCDNVKIIPFSRISRISGVMKGLVAGQPANTSSFWSLRAHRNICKAASAWGIQAVHVHRLRMMPYAQRLGLPYMLDLTDSLTNYFKTARSSLRGWRRWYAALDLPAIRQHERRWSETAAVCLAITERESRHIRGLGVHTPVVTVPNGIDPAYWSFRDPGRRNREVLFLGNMAYPPNSIGLRWFVRSVAPLISRAAGRVTLTVAGGGVSRSLARECRNSVMPVDFTGYVPDPRPLLHRASMLVCPLPLAVGLQNKAVQAFACGTPVVATPAVVSAIGAVPGRELLRADSSIEFARAVSLLLDSPARRRLIARAARRLAVRSFSEKSAEISLKSAESILVRSVRKAGR